MFSYMRLLWSNFCYYVSSLLFSFSIFSDRWSLKIENENNSTKTLTAEVSYIGLGVYIETNPGWLELPFARTNLHGSSLFEPLKFYCRCHSRLNKPRLMGELLGVYQKLLAEWKITKSKYLLMACMSIFRASMFIIKIFAKIFFSSDKARFICDRVTFYSVPGYTQN